MKETAAKVPNAKFKFVTFHHDIYGAGPHSTEALITNLRAALFPTFDELNVDVIFMGHDHSYVRTYVMKGDIPQRNQLIDSKGRVVNPTGSMYITANSASGSKYYELKPTPEVYSEVRSQLKVPTFSTINVDKHSVSVDTYRTDTMEKVDTWSMVKTSLPMLQGLVEEYSSKGELNTPVFNQLTNTLKQAEHQLDKGSKKQAVKFMQDFLKHLNNEAMQKNITSSAKDVLADNAEELILYWTAQ
jgi:hypothetical protein